MFLASVSGWHLQSAAGDPAVNAELDQIFSTWGGGNKLRDHGVFWSLITF